MTRILIVSLWTLPLLAFACIGALVLVVTGRDYPEMEGI